MEIINNPTRLKLNEYVSHDANQGYVYVIDYGVRVKIGSTVNMKQRFSVLKSEAKQYSNISTIKRVAISDKHFGFRQTKKLLHMWFHGFVLNKPELFNTTLDEVIAESNRINIGKSSAEEINQLHHIELMIRSMVGGSGGGLITNDSPNENIDEIIRRLGVKGSRIRYVKSKEKLNILFA